TLGGTVDYDPSMDGFFFGRGTTTLSVRGIATLLDATALTPQSMAINQVTDWFASSTPQSLHLVPGTYDLYRAPSALVTTFSITAAGTVDYDASADQFLTGRGTTMLTVRGVPIAINATPLGNQQIAIPYLTPFFSASAIKDVRVAPGTYSLLDASY